MYEHPAWAKEFYGSTAWRNLSAYIKKERGGLCERCLERGIISPAEIVHHVVWLTPENIRDPEVALNPDNLICVCRRCHEEIHTGRRWRVDAEGKIV